MTHAASSFHGITEVKKTHERGPEEDAFYKNMKDVMFLRNDYDAPINPSALDDDVQWLKDHPGVRFFVDGYASITGNMV
jgi:hypothetical protein